jgi:hypothetical protein
VVGDVGCEAALLEGDDRDVNSVAVDARDIREESIRCIPANVPPESAS